MENKIIKKETAIPFERGQLYKAKERYKQAQEVPAELIEALQKGENEAFDRLYIHFSEPLLNFLTILLHDEDEAMNILQDTFLYILENRTKFDFSRSIKGLLYTLSKRRAIDYFRQRKRDEIMQYEFRNDDEPSIEANYIRDEIAEIIQMAIKTMPPMRKKVFLMQQDGKNAREIARELGITEATVSFHLKAAKAELRRMIGILAFFLVI